MKRFYAYAIVTLGAFSVTEASGQTPAGVNLVEKAASQTGATMEERPAAAKIPSAQQASPGGNPLWGIPIGSLSATRERPVFSVSRRPPPLPVAAPLAAEEPPPAPSAEPVPSLTLVGTAIGKPQNVALILDQATKNLVRLHVGEAVSGWSLRSVDLRAMTLEKNSKTVTLALPVPGSGPASPPAPVASGISRAF